MKNRYMLLYLHGVSGNWVGYMGITELCMWDNLESMKDKINRFKELGIKYKVVKTVNENPRKRNKRHVKMKAASLGIEPRSIG